MNTAERLKQNRDIALKLATIINNIYPQQHDISTAKIKSEMVETKRMRKNNNMRNCLDLDDILNSISENVTVKQNFLLYADKKVPIHDIDIDYLLSEKMTFNFNFKTLIDIKEVVDAFRPHDYKSAHPLI